jgi:CDP-glucose 4,6-dehydratase
VLDPLFGYLLLASKMKEEPDEYADAWNFGPDCLNTIDVQTLTEKIIRVWGSGTWKKPSQNENAPHEAGYLKLDSSKSMVRLGWKPAYRIDEAIQKTIGWYREYYRGKRDMYEFCSRQVETYMHEVTKQE